MDKSIKLVVCEHNGRGQKGAFLQAKRTIRNLWESEFHNWGRVVDKILGYYYIELHSVLKRDYI